MRAHALAAIARGYEPHIYCVGREDRDRLTDFGVVHQRRSRWHGLHRRLGIAFTLTSAWNGPALAAALRRDLGRHRQPLLHGVGVWGAAAAAARRSGLAVPYIVSAFTSLEQEFAVKQCALDRRFPARQRARARAEAVLYRLTTRHAEVRAYRGADLVCVNYDAVRRELERSLGAGIRFHRLPYASDTAFRHAARRPPPRLTAAHRPTRIVALARHDERKGLHLLLEALASMRDRGVAFEAVLVGAGALLATHRRITADLGLESVVSLPGPIEDAYPTLEGAEVFVLPSLQEGSGSLALLEAAQAGLAIVATAVDGLVEDIEDGVNGLLVPAGDARALASALARLAARPDLRLRLGAAARRTFEERFSAHHLERDLGDLYDHLLAHDSRPAALAATAIAR